MPSFWQAKPTSDALADIGKSIACANRMGSEAGAKAKDWDVFAGVLGATPSGIIAVIGGENDEVAGLEFRFKFRQAAVKGFKAGRVSYNIASVAEFGIEIDEIGKKKAAIGKIINFWQHRIKQRHIAICFDFSASVAMGKNITDFTDGRDIALC